MTLCDVYPLYLTNCCNKSIEGFSDGNLSDFHESTLNGRIYLIIGTKLARTLTNFELEILGNQWNSGPFKEELIVTSMGS